MTRLDAREVGGWLVGRYGSVWSKGARCVDLFMFGRASPQLQQGMSTGKGESTSAGVSAYQTRA